MKATPVQSMVMDLVIVSCPDAGALMQEMLPPEPVALCAVEKLAHGEVKVHALPSLPELET
ncbi:hypothetical protein UP09_33550 [Bradyrhizobium sp. LTSP885]|nr:hypothetical protein UP09_33550 [Bradyrhizobium sp. LTSP885]